MNRSLRDLVADVQKAEVARRRQQDVETQRMLREAKMSELRVKRHVRRTKPEEYIAWLEAHIDQLPSRELWRLMPAEFYTAFESFSMVPLYGASLIQLIVPQGITVECRNVGHCQIYLPDGRIISPRGDLPTIYLPPQWLKFIH